RAATATIRRRLINVPARIAASARRLRLHLPTNWPWQKGWTALYQVVLPSRAHAT
ncbi:MAG: IS1380 family transposase, partial [Catenulispora sp.]